MVSAVATVLLYLDAFRWDYLNPSDAPFLYSLVGNSIYIPKLYSTAGFTKRTAMLCGAYPDASGHFTRFAFDPSGSPYTITPLQRRVANLLDRAKGAGVRGSGRAFAAFRRYLERRSRRPRSAPSFAKFPLGLWPWLRATSNEGWPYNEDYEVPNLLQDLVRAERRFSYWLYPAVTGSDDQVLRTVVRGIDPHSQLSLVQLSDLDQVGHRYTSDSPERQLCVRKTDFYVQILFEQFERTYGRINWVILGDHGMTDIVSTIDAGDLIHKDAAKRGLRHGEHYLLFLDSTMARVWSLSAKADRFVQEVFNKPEFQNNGTIIDEEVATRYHIPRDTRMYGDRIWWANPGVLVHPDCFSSAKLYVGMHGYFPDYPDMLSFMLVHGPNIGPALVDNAQLIDVCPTLCDLLEAPAPPICQGRSLLRGQGCQEAGV